MGDNTISNNKKDLSMLNCTMSGLLALVLMVPLHEFFHFATSLIYGQDVLWFSANAVAEGDNIDYSTLNFFDRIMLPGGSASILNIIIAMILFFILIKVSMGPMMRIFLIQYMGMHMCEGFGYFMIGGMFGGFGDWGNVLSAFADQPGTVTALRVTLSVIGSAGIVFSFFAMNYMSYYFIENNQDRKERFYVGLRLYLVPFIVTTVFSVIVDMNSRLYKLGYGAANPGFTILTKFMMISFFWAFMFTWVMVKPPKESRFLYHLVKEPKYVMWAVTAVLLAIDLFVLAPGIDM